MELRRRVRDRICFVLMILGTVGSALCGQTLDCYNDSESIMFCHFEAQNCAEYNLTIKSNDKQGDKTCIPKRGDGGKCCCSFDIGNVVVGETYNASVWKGGEITEFKLISITQSIKPKKPIIKSVEESNGNFQIQWTTDMKESYIETLSANVTYGIKGGTEKVSEFLRRPTRINGLNSYEIQGKNLRPSTTYVVSVKTFTDLNNKYGDSSDEKEFTTSMSPAVLAMAIIISLSVAAVTISGAMYCIFVKLKKKWWDTVAKCPNPKLLSMHPNEQEILKPVPPIISSVCIEHVDPDDSKPWSKGSLRDISSGSPQQSSGISTGSSCLSYANTEPSTIKAGVQDALNKVFPNISPISPLTTNPLTEFDKDTSSVSSCFDNKTYSILIPNCPQQIMTDSSEVQTQTEMLCDSTYHPSAGDIMTCVDQQGPACPLVIFPVDTPNIMPTDMSYQQCNADSGGFSYAEDFSLSSGSSGTNVVASCDPVPRVECENFDEEMHGNTEEVTVDENPCYNCVPALSFLPVDDAYQAFQTVVEQPDIVFSAERSGEEEEGSLIKMPQSFLSPELQRPFLSSIPAGQSMPVIMDSGYQCV